MRTSDPTLHELRTALSLPAPSDALSMSRRHFLQAAAAGIGVSMLPSWIADSAGAAPSAPAGGGVLVFVVLDGGCDGLDMVPPVGLGAYHDARGAIAIGESEALPVGAGRGLHPSLSRLKARFDAGDVAIIDGVGNARHDLSHFSAMADFHAGGPAGALGRTGWVGRYLDQSSGGPFEAIAIGERIPLVAHGADRDAIALPSSRDLVPERRSWSGPMDQALDRWDQMTTGQGVLADRVATINASLFDSSDTFWPSYPADTPTTPFVEELQLCANLVNADVGTRVFTLRHGPYDSHNDQPAMLGARMTELDAAIETFFQTLGSHVVDDVTLVCVSEFGRRVRANGGSGTDHGAGNSMIAVGRRVIGGFHGSLPSLTSLTSDGNLTHEIDYRSVYATLIDDILGADHATILGGEFARVPFLDGASTPPPTSTPPTTSPPTTAPPPTTTPPPTTAPPPTTTPPPTTAPEPRPEPTPAPVPAAPPRSEPPSRWPFRARRWTPPGGTAGTVADGRVVTADQADALRLYRALTDREPDAAVARKIVDARARGSSPDSIAERLGLTADLDARYSSLSDDRFVQLAYRRLLGRELDAAGLHRWSTSTSRRALDRAEVVRWISSTPEFRRRFQYTAIPR